MERLEGEKLAPFCDAASEVTWDPFSQTPLASWDSHKSCPDSRGWTITSAAPSLGGKSVSHTVKRARGMG